MPLCSISKRLLKFLLCLFLCSCVISSHAQFRTSKAFPEQYKKQNRDAIAYIVDGKVDTIITYFHAYLEAFPEDIESHYVLAIAYTQKGDLQKAMEQVRRSIDKGLPIERYIAGPRSLLKPLTESPAFKSYAKGKYVSLLHVSCYKNQGQTLRSSV